MRVAALLGLLAAAPAGAGEPVTPTQARANVVTALALTPELAKGARSGDLQIYLAGMSSEQRAAALRSLAAKEGELGDDPATLTFIGQAYAGLGQIQKVREAAEAVRRRDPENVEAKQLLVWVTSQEKMPARGSRDPGGAASMGGGAGAGRSRPA